MEKEPSFLDRLTFDAALYKTFIAKYFSNIRAIILVVLTLTVSGLAAFFTLPKELNPDIKIPIVFVSTTFPGASPEDVEKLLTIPLEDAVSGLSNVQKVSSTSQESVSFLNIEFSSGTDPQKAKEDVQGAIDGVTDIPESAESSKVQVLDFQNQPVIIFSLSGKADEATLERFADLLKDRLDTLRDTKKVELSYRNEQDIVITIRPEKVREKNLSLQTIAQNIETAIGQYPGGTISTARTSFVLTQRATVRSIEELRTLPISVQDTIIPLGMLADISLQTPKNSAVAYYGDSKTTPHRTITFSIFKTDEADATSTVQEVLAITEKWNVLYGNQFIIEPIFNGAKEIKKSFDQLFRDFAVTLFLVFIVLFIFFGLRQSIIAVLAIPLTFLGTFLVMAGSGISINFIALFSLLLALGILVDNAIVIISAMSSYERAKNFPPQETALLVWRDFRSVIFTTTITTVWAFLPLLLSTGIIGEFIKPIPIVVSTALSLSAFIALLIVIPAMAWMRLGTMPRRTLLFFHGLLFILGSALLFLLMPEGNFRLPLFIVAGILLLLLVKTLHAFREKIHEYEQCHFTKFFRLLHKLSQSGLFQFDHLAHRYERFISTVLNSKSARRKTLIGLIIFSLFSYALVPLGYVVNEFFPQDNQDTVYIGVELPKNTVLEKSNEELLRLLETFRTLPEVLFVYAEIGNVMPTDNTPVVAREHHRLLFTLALSPSHEREKTSGEIVRELNASFRSYSHGILSAGQISGGPPAGSDLELKLSGDDLSVLQQYAENIQDSLRQTPGISNVKISVTSGSSKIVYVPRQEILAQNNIRPDALSVFLRTLGNGFTVKNDVRFADEKQDILIRFVDNDTSEHPQDLGLLSYSEGQKNIPLLALGDFILETNPALITRENQKRTLSVSASVENGFSVSTLNTDLEKLADSLNLPDGYAWQTGGVNDENNKSVQSILQAMVLSALLIFATMVIQFTSFRKALIVILVIPLAISGVFILFALSGTPLSFPALIGVLALFGIVVNNSIIMVDKINRNMDSGLPLNQAIAQGAASRLEPILLTALTTIVGLIPITLSDPIWQGLGGAIIAGLTFSGIAKLFFIPVIYRVWFGTKESV
ncbi:MAG: efflux RND transporter permease subunit [Candidatus Moranbacteria bacterium]|nr:efflux RND transporter permease subunit [Candidatus Moranbacteria bacterium]